MSPTKGKIPRRLLHRMRNEQKREKERLQKLRDRIAQELGREKQAEQEERKRLMAFGKVGRLVMRSIFRPKKKDGQLVEMKMLIGKAMSCKPKKANEYYRDIYAAYHALPEKKKRMVRKDILKVYRRIAG